MAKYIKIEGLYELNETYQKVMLWFFSYPNKEPGLNDLADAIKSSKKSVARAVEKLVREGFLIKTEIGNSWRISCSQRHIYNYSRKVAFNLSQIYELGVISQVHKVAANPLAIVLFGSYRKGDDTEKSDIDIAVEVAGDRKTEIKEIKVLPHFGFRKNVPVNLHLFSRKAIDLNLFANIANGIVLEGFLEVRP